VRADRERLAARELPWSAPPSTEAEAASRSDAERATSPEADADAAAPPPGRPTPPRALTREVTDMSSTTDRGRTAAVPVACRKLDEQATATERLLAKLNRALATAPPAKRPTVEARIRDTKRRRAELRRELQECVEINAPGVPPSPPTRDPLPRIIVAKRDIDREVHLAIAAATRRKPTSPPASSTASPRLGRIFLPRG
jgi:hypothetical protein